MKKIGISLALMSGLSLCDAVIARIIFSDGNVIDPIAIYLLWVGIKFIKEERTDIKWPSIWSGFNCLASILIIGVSIIWRDSLHLGEFSYPSSPWLLYYIIIDFLIYLIWNAANLKALLKSKNMQNQGMDPTSANAQSSCQ